MAKRKWNKWIKQARAKYPNPISLKDSKDTNNEYCVGGAICQTLGRNVRFPASYSLDHALSQANPNLGAMGLGFACSIIRANDTRNFDKAWELADEALNFKPATK